MKVSDLLRNKGQEVVKVCPDEPVFNVMKLLLENKIGALIVCDETEKIVGIISERDILKEAYYDYEGLKSKKVSALMTTNLIVGIPEDDLDYVMGIMTNNRIRHLPIVTKEGIAGIISIGDIVKFQLEESEVMNRYLKEYMYNTY